MVVRIYGNRPIKTLTGQQTRPTSSKVREALFNTWQGHIDGCRWLDLCAGSGAMGAEALCRGAKIVVGIEKLPKACSVIQENWERIARPEQSIRVIRGDVAQKLQTLTDKQFDRMYFDPPYASGLYLPVLKAILAKGLLAQDGEIAVEHDRDLPLPRNIDIKSVEPTQTQCASTSDTIATRLTCSRQKQYGRTTLTFYSLTIAH
ncbi:MAG: 16S rRNA (guanine(966)-N(2))-methyltransferase RsmD [Leptolyngbyaceae bacterium]|nr:16S rRNA (guanine(966)-N(2))-methyltransferase RsmD [Leptolyngbyaceae bacterium]